MDVQQVQQEIIGQWQERIALGDSRAFRQLFDYYAEKLTHFAFSIIRNQEAAVEIMDEVFVKVWKNRSGLPQVKNLTTYLYTAIKNTSLNYLSKKANEQITEPFDFVNINLHTGESPEQSLINAEIFKKINAAVDALPPKCKIIFKLVREDGLKYREVAEILNISINTVDAQMVIAVKKISEKVNHSFHILPRSLARKK